MDDLNYLQEFLLINHNLETKIKKSDSIYYIKNIYIIYLILFFLILLLFLIIYFIKFGIKSIVPILILLYFIQKYFFLVYHYKNINKFDNHFVKKDLNNLDFQTGDILQETVNWDNSTGLLTYLIGNDFLHNIFILKFNNNFYGLHFIKSNFGYPEKYLSFDSKHIEIFPLIDYLKENDYSVKYYRLFKIKNSISNELVFNFIKTLNMKELFFSYLPNLNQNHIIKNSNNFHCLSFILKLLNYCNIIPEFNFQNITSDDLLFLPKLSNLKYEDGNIISFF